ncbi:ABC transporter substrate-binding protein [Microbacterium sp.]|uniref:ABC transporter substrate-binding protein n=1 Tax=Microbacterium sp. TaxID=51671 RepID=UPI003F9684AF
MFAGRQQGPDRRGFRISLAAASSLLAVTALSGCGAGQEEGSTGFDPSVPTELTVWSWDPSTQIVADAYETAHPQITVNVVNVGANTDQYTKMRAAHAAGNGAPDVSMITTHVSQFVLEGMVEDLTPYGVEDIRDSFAPWALDSQKVEDGHVYALPLDAGLMGFMYRADILADAGIEPPTTWPEFVAAAQEIRNLNPDQYLANFSLGNWAWFHALLWQGGSKPYHLDGTDITIDIDNDNALRVAALWDDLLHRDLVKPEAPFTTPWVAGMDDGTYAGWMAPVWGPILLEEASNTEGKWAVAPLPRWDDIPETQPVWSSGAYLVTSDSKNKAAAADFVKFVTQDPAAVDAAVTASPYTFYPVRSLYESESWQDADLPFYGDQKANRVYADIAEHVDPVDQNTPFDDFVVLQANQLVSAAVSNGSPLGDALKELQRRVTEYADSQGFTVID